MKNRGGTRAVTDDFIAIGADVRSACSTRFQTRTPFAWRTGSQFAVDFVSASASAIARDGAPAWPRENSAVEVPSAASYARSPRLTCKRPVAASAASAATPTARAVAPGDDPATLPQPVSIELYDDGGSPQSSGVDPEFGELGKRKRKRKAGTAPEKGFGA